MKLKDIENAYKNFFVDSDVGRELFKQMSGVKDSNIAKAMSDNSLDFLARSKGNQEIIDLIDNVLKGAKPRE